MNGGDADAGGAQVNPSYTPSSTPGLRPDSSATQDTELDTVLTISHDQSSPDVPTQPNPQPLTTPSITGIPTSPTPPLSSSVYAPVSQAQYTPPVPQSSQSADQLISQTFAPSAPLGQPISMASSMPQSAQYAQPLPSSPFPPQPPIMQAPTQPTYSDNGDIIIGSPTPQKSKKGLIIALVCLGILVVVAIIFLAISQTSQNNNSSKQPDNSAVTQYTTKKEIYSDLYDFNFEHYSTLTAQYNNSIGFTPNLQMSQYDIILPYERGIPFLATDIDEAISFYNNISPKIPDILQDGDDIIDIKYVKDTITKSLQGMRKNADLLNDFYDAYYLPLTQESIPSVCTKTPEIQALEQGDTANVAEQYYQIYCQAIEFLNQSDDYIALQQYLASSTANATESLNQLLIEAPSAEMQINKLFKELTR